MKLEISEHWRRFGMDGTWFSFLFYRKLSLCIKRYDAASLLRPGSCGWTISVTKHSNKECMSINWTVNQSINQPINQSVKVSSAFHVFPSNWLKLVWTIFLIRCQINLFGHDVLILAIACIVNVHGTALILLIALFWRKLVVIFAVRLVEHASVIVTFVYFSCVQLNYLLLKRLCMYLLSVLNCLVRIFNIDFRSGNCLQIEAKQWEILVVLYMVRHFQASLKCANLVKLIWSFVIVKYIYGRSLL
jgi:hypothetical protein